MSEEIHKEEKRSEVFDIVNELKSLGLKRSRRKVSLKKFAEKLEVPQPILICKGKFGICGRPTRSEPHLTPELLAWCTRFRLKAQAQALAQCTHFERSKIHRIGARYELDDDYEGWLEIVSEDVREMSYIPSVADLARCSNKTFVLMKSMHAHQRASDGEWESCTLHIGYRITVGREILTGLPDCGCGELLRCESASALAWESSESVYLPLGGSGRFALITGDDLLVGPKTVSSFGAWMLPLNAKLMEGSPPPIDHQITPYMRLYSSGSKEVLTVLPLRKDARLVHIPIKNRMELKVLDNLGAVLKSPRYCEILHQVQLTVLPKHTLRETHPRQQHQQTTPVLLSSSPEQNFKPSTKYISGWFHYTDDKTFEGGGYDHSFILATPIEDDDRVPPLNIENENVTDELESRNLRDHQVRRVPNRNESQPSTSLKDNVSSIETESMKPCVEQEISGFSAVSKDKTLPLNIGNGRVTSESETRNQMDLPLKRVHESHEFDLAAPSVKTGSTEPCVEQFTSGHAAVHKNKSPPRIEKESSTDVLDTLNSDDPQLRRVPDLHKSDLVPPPKENDSTMETVTMQPSVEQTSEISALHLENNLPKHKKICSTDRQSRWCSNKKASFGPTNNDKV